MAIWEPCNYVSNLAYDRLLVEMCVQQVLVLVVYVAVEDLQLCLKLLVKMCLQQV